jgi:hypothetical protein
VVRWKEQEFALEVHSEERLQVCRRPEQYVQSCLLVQGSMMIAVRLFIPANDKKGSLRPVYPASEGSDASKEAPSEIHGTVLSQGVLGVTVER